MKIKKFNQLNESNIEKDLYKIEHTEDGHYHTLLGIVRAKDKIEAQDLWGVKSTERGFYPATKITKEQYDKMLSKVEEEYNKVKNILI